MTKLTWDEKYKDGKKIGPVSIALPFQTVETVNESIRQCQLSLDLFSPDLLTDWRKCLIRDAKKYFISYIIPEFADKVNLIYIDLTFDTSADFSFQMEGETFTKKPSIIEQKTYLNTWGRGLDSYLQ